MAYSPENNPYIPGDPYSYDLKWLVQKIKELFADYEGLSSDLDALRAYVETLSVPAQLRKIVLELINDGTMTQILSGIITGFVTPEMYGAVGDGVTDDTAALQAAIDDAVPNKAQVLLTKNYLISDTITTPGDISIYGLNLMEYDVPTILVKEGTSIAFNVTHAGCIFSNFRLLGTKYNGAYRILQNFIGFEVSGSDDNYNADAKFYGMEIGYAETGIWGTGRNIHVDDCLITHCRYGIHFEKLSGVTAYRGMIVTNCRFHGIGEELEIYEGVEQEILIAGNCAGVFLEMDDGTETAPQVSAVQIQGNYSDQGGALVKGAAQSLAILSNTVKTFYTPAIVLEAGTGSHNPSSGGAITIIGNSFDGVYGTDAQGVTHTFPDYAISIKYINRITAISNNFAGYNSAVFLINDAAHIAISGNTANYLNLNTTAFVEAYNSTITVSNNVNATGTACPGIIGTGNTVGVKNNFNFNYDASVGNIYPAPDKYVKIADITFNVTALSFAYADEFILTRTDGVALFKIRKKGTAFTSSLNTTDTYAQWVVFTANVPRIYRYTYSTQAITYVDNVPGTYEYLI